MTIHRRSDIDRCGYGTPFGCDRYLRDGEGNAHIIMNGRIPVNHQDTGHVTMHKACFDKLEPGTTVRHSRRIEPTHNNQGESHERHRVSA